MVSYCPEHKDHSCDITQIRLHREQSEAIAVNTFRRCIRFSSFDCKCLRYDQFVVSLQMRSDEHHTRIWHQQRRRTAQKLCRQSEAIALKLAWVHYTQQEPSSKNSAWLIMFQGETSPVNIKSEDFMLILASDAQITGARQFCGPSREICLDSTHATNSYDFQLTTVLAIDEHDEGHTVAFCYSNRVDEGAASVLLHTYSS